MVPQSAKIAQSGHTDSDTSPQGSIIWLSNMTTGSFLLFKRIVRSQFAR